jgi:hypothetical protein
VVADFRPNLAARVVVVGRAGADDVLLVEDIADVDREVGVLDDPIVEGGVEQRCRIALRGIGGVEVVAIGIAGAQ